MAKMSSWTVAAVELIDQSHGRLLNVVRQNRGNSPHASEIQNTLSNV